MLSKTLILGSILAASVLARPAYSGEIIPDPCRRVLPQQLEEAIKRDHPGWEIVTLRHLPDWRQMEYEKQRETSCPGVAKVNFYGDGRLAYALSLIKQSGTENAGLLLAQLDKSGRWTLTMLWEVGCACEPKTEPAGEYKDVYGEKTIRSKGEVIVLDLGSVARLFAWTGDKIDSIHIKD